jgi:hypothetical protein
VLWAYAWGTPAPLEKYDGPDEWQAEFLRQLGEQVKKRNFRQSHASFAHSIHDSIGRRHR